MNKPKKDRNLPTVVDVQGFINNPSLIKLIGEVDWLESDSYEVKLKRVRTAKTSPSETGGKYTLAGAKADLKTYENSLPKEKLKALKDLRALCQKEVNRLALIYDSDSLIKYVSNYRHALIKKFGKACSAVPFFTAGRLVRSRNVKYETKIDDADPRRFPKEDIESLITLAKECLTDTNYAKRTLGVMALTGRRPIEILQKGRFEDCGKEGWVTFFGQAKSSMTDEDGFEIPVLGGLGASELMAVVNSIRTQKNFEGKTAEQVHDTTSKWLGETSKRTFTNLLGKEVKPYDLRGLWCAVQNFLVRPKTNMNPMNFYKVMLGHSKGQGKSEKPYMIFEVV